jgi:hypothetical protein
MSLVGTVEPWIVGLLRARLVATEYAFAWGYLGLFALTELIYLALDPGGQAALLGWASTSVANLEHEPVGPLIVSTLVAQASYGYYVAWLALIPLAVFGANRALGNVRALLVCAAGQVIGSLVSEGIVAYRVDAGQLPVADRHLIDVGPSYVVMSAIVIALICGTWLARVAAALDLAILVFVGNIFGGLSSLDVAAVGHLTAAVTATVSVIVVLHRHRRGDGQRGDGSAVTVRPLCRPRCRSGR